MVFAYADPPYPGQARRYIEQREVDHAALIAQLESDYPDGWMLSTASTTLAEVLSVCPVKVRLLAWVKPFASFKPGVGVAYAWEPLLLRGGRRRERTQPTVRDWVAANITLKRGLVGAKPEVVAEWICDVLNVQPGDRVDDLFPGTGGMSCVFQRRTA